MTQDHGEGLSGLAHSQAPGEVVSRYDGWAGDYESDVRSWGYTLPEDIADRAVRHTEGGRLLDAGCGTGLIGHAVRERSFAGHLVGLDVSLASLRLAADAGVYDAVSQGDLRQRLPFADESFDTVVCGGVLTYVPDTESTLREFLRVVVLDGAVVFSQRTDLWAERECDAVIQALRDDGVAVAVEAPVPYLPDLAEYGTAIEVIFVTLFRS